MRDRIDRNWPTWATVPEDRARHPREAQYVDTVEEVLERVDRTELEWKEAGVTQERLGELDRLRRRVVGLFKYLRSFHPTNRGWEAYRLETEAIVQALTALMDGRESVGEN